MDIFYGSLIILLVLCVGTQYLTGASLPSTKNVNFMQFQRTYISVYLLAMAADWLQGPHVYALYESYGMTTQQIQELFVAGFGSSLVFGTFIGSLADQFGRRLNCVIYGLTYAAGCVTKHFPNYYVLMCGRLMAGLSTSILYSAFESWAICEHHGRGFGDDLLSNLFAHATLGNSVVAILAGVVAQGFADVYGFVAPFDVAIVVLLLMTILTIATWNENYGDTSSNTKANVKLAVKHIIHNRKVFCLGTIQGLFEGAMYTWVLEWTPALSGEDNLYAIPHGIIFTGFMLSVMIGSAVFKLLSHKFAVESFMRPVLFVASLSLLVPVALPGHQLPIYVAFLVFELCVGIFWPAMCTMRGKFVPEETRSTVMNFFRIPLNLIVVVILLSNLSMSTMFVVCSIFLLLSCGCQQILFKASLRHIVQVPNSEPDSKIKLSIDDEMPVDEPLLNADPEKKEPDAI